MVKFTKQEVQRRKSDVSVGALCICVGALCICLVAGMLLQEGRICQFPSWHTDLQMLNFHFSKHDKNVIKIVTNNQFYRHSKPSWCLTAVSLKV